MKIQCKKSKRMEDKKLKYLKKFRKNKIKKETPKNE